MQINLAIAHLLLRHNCVIIPSFGGFVANVRTAQIDVQKGYIQPPRKVLTFNANLVNNDGLLSNYLAKTEAISFDEANAAVLKTSSNWKSELEKGNRIEIEKVGFLYLDDERNLNFEQDRFFNLLLSSYGLENVQFIAEEKLSVSKITDVEETEKILSVEDNPSIDFQITASPKKEDSVEQEKTKTAVLVDLHKPKKKRNYWKYAAAAVLLPIAFYSFWIPMRTDVLQSGMLLSNDFNPFKESNTEQYTPRTVNLELAPLENNSLQEQLKDLPEDVDLFAYHLDEYKYVQIKVNTSKKLTSANIPSEKETRRNAPFQIIAGCFSSKRNAQQLIKQLNKAGFAAYLLDKNKGLHRVSATGVSSLTETKELKSKLATSGFESWVLSL